MKDFKPRALQLEVTTTKLTSAAGLGTLIEAFDLSALSAEFKKALPARDGYRSQGSYRLGLIQIASFLRGHDCLDDIEEFRHDDTLSTIMNGETVVPKTMGDFLRDYDDQNLNKTNSFLAIQSMSYRKHLERHLQKPYKPSLAPRLSIDSTSHVQQAQKMEGLAYNYKDEWCLDSQVIFDELGFCWDLALRSGNSKSGTGASEQVRRAFSNFNFNDEKYLSGDSAYCYQGLMVTCLNLGIKFTFTANQATTRWEDHIDSITNWTPWIYLDEEIKKSNIKKETLPSIEVGSFLWTPSWNQGLRFQVCVKRMTKDQGDFLQGMYKYYGIVTNMDLSRQSAQSALEFHNKRGNAENFIREEKYGFDLKHFPCQKLKANHAFAGLAMVAHNLLRWAAIHDQPHRPKFSKKMRRMFIDIPGKMVSHGRTLTLKTSEYYFQEVNRLREALGLKLYVVKLKVMNLNLINSPNPTG